MDLDALHPELRLRVLAATAHADIRIIEPAQPSTTEAGPVDVYAVAGDRLVCMSLAVRPDGSVAEITQVVSAGDIVRIEPSGDRYVVQLPGPSTSIEVDVPLAIGRALEARLDRARRPEPAAGGEEDTEPDFEASVKGVGQGIAGRIKEMVGEFIDDPDLEEQGIVQQLEGKLRRAGTDVDPES